MLPLIVDNGKIITVGSRVGAKMCKVSPEVREGFQGDNATEEKITELANAYITSYRDGGVEGPKKLGFPDYMYGMSKIMINSWVKWFAQT